MLKNNIRKISLAIIAMVMMSSSIPFSALAEENSQSENIKLSLVDESKEIYVGEEFEVKVENNNDEDKTLIDLPEGIIYGDNSHDEGISFNGALVSVLSGSERILKLKSQREGSFEITYNNTIGDSENHLKFTVNKMINEEEIIPETKIPPVVETFSGESITISGLPAEWISGDVYEIRVDVSFDDVTSNNKVVEFKVSDAFELVSYYALNPKTGTPETAMPGQIATQVLNVKGIEKHSKYQTYTGSVIYDFKNTANVIPLVFQVKASPSMIYESGNHNGAIKIHSEKNGVSYPDISRNAYVKTERKIVTQNKYSTSAEYTVIEKSNEDLGYGNMYLNLDSHLYVKSGVWKVYYPKNAKYVSTSSAYTYISHNDSTTTDGWVMFKIDEGIYPTIARDPESWPQIKINTEDLEKGKHTLSGGIQNEFDIIMYNDVPLNKITSSGSATSINVISEDEITKKLDIAGENTERYYHTSTSTERLINMIFRNGSPLPLKNVHMSYDFDSDVMVSSININFDNALSEIKFKSKHNDTLRDGVQVEGTKGLVTQESLGISPNDSITYIEFKIGDVRPNFGAGDSSRGMTHSIVGRVEEGAVNRNITIKSFSKDESGEIVENSENQKVFRTGRAGAQNPQMGGSVSPSVRIEAGTTETVTHTLGNILAAGNTRGLSSPVFYIKVPNNSYITNIKVNQGSENVIVGNPAEYKDNDGNTIIRIETNIKFGHTSILGPEFNISKVLFSYDITFNKSAGNGFIPYYNIAFMGLRNSKINMGTAYVVEDTTNMNGYGDVNASFVGMSNNTAQGTGIQVNAKRELVIDSYLVGDDGLVKPPYIPGDLGTTVGFTPSSTGTYKVEIANNTTDATTNGITAFIPIPKKDQNFEGEMQLNKFPFSMKATNVSIVVKDENGENVESEISKYEVKYSNQANKDNYNIESSSHIYSQSVPDDTSNMIRISSNSPLPAGYSIHLEIKYKIDVVKEDITEEMLISPLDFSPLIRLSVGDEFGTRVGALLQMGSIQGTVFIDENYNGEFDSGEQILSNIPVKLYDFSGAYIDTVNTDSLGNYNFEDIPNIQYILDFSGAIDSSKEFTKTVDYSGSNKPSTVRPTGENKGKTEGVTPSGKNARNINAGLIENAGVDKFKDNISLPEMKLVEPHPNGTAHIQGSVNALLSVNPVGVKDFINSDITYSSEDPQLVKVTKVDNYNIKVEALRKSPEIVGTVKTNIVVTFTDIYGNKTSNKFEVSVRANDKPIITVDPNPGYFTLTKGQTYSTVNDTGISLSDPQEPTLSRGDIVPDLKGQTLNEVGIYTIELNFTDADGNVADTQDRMIVVTDNDNPIVDGHLVRFNKSYTIKLKDYPVELEDKKNEARDVDHGNVKITRISDNQDIAPILILKDDQGKSTYNAAYGNQYYKFRFVGKSGANVDNRIDVKVSDNGKDIGTHYLLAEDAYLSKTEAKAIKGDFANQSVILTNARAEEKVGNGVEALTYVKTDKAFTETPGIYTVTFKYSNGEEITAKVHVLDFDEVVKDGEYIIAANHFMIGEEDVKAGNFNLVSRADAKVFRVTDLDTNLNSKSDTVLTVTPNEQDVTFTPVDTNLPAGLTIDVKAKIQKGTVVDGDKYVLVIDEGIRIQKNEAEKYLQQGAGTTNDIIAKANAKAYLKTNLSETGTVNYDGGTFSATASGNATFSVVEDTLAAPKTIPVTVITDLNKPIITIDNAHKVVKLPVGDTDFNTNARYKEGVTAEDVDNTTNQITFDNGKLTGTPPTVDTSKPGVHTIEYNATDKNGETAVPVYKIVVVGDDIEKVGDYYIYANNVVEEVATFKGLDEAAMKSKIAEKSEAYAIHSKTGERKTVYVDDLNGFEAKANTYTVKLKVTDVPSTDFAEIDVVLTDGSVIKGDKYYISAKDFTGGLSVAREILKLNNNVELFRVMDVKVTPIHGNEVYDMNDVTVTNKINEVKAQDWPMVFTADKDPLAVIGKKLTITDDETGGIENDLYLGASPFVIGEENVKAGLTEADYIAYSKVNAKRASTGDPLGFAVSGSGLDGTLGSKTITFQVAGHPTRTETVIVEVVPGKTAVDGDYVIAGKDFTITGAEAKELKENIGNTAKDSILLNQSAAHLNSYERYTLNTKGTVVVEDRSAITNAEKADGYTTKYRVNDGANTLVKPELSLQVKVNMGTAPVINTHSHTVIAVGETFNYADGFKDGSAINDGILTGEMKFSDIKPANITDNIEKDKVGIYEVEYKYEDSYGREATAKHLVVVSDGSVVVTDKHIIFGQNVVLNVDKIKVNAEANIKAASEPYAYVIATGNKVDDNDITINRGNVEAKQGKYEAYIEIKNDPKSKDIVVGVTEGDVVEGEEYFIITGKGTTVGQKRADEIVKDTSNEKLFETMSIIAIHKTDKTPVPASKILVTDRISDTTAKDWPMVFQVDGDPKAKTQALVLTVTEDTDVDGKDGLYIGSNPFVVGRENIAEMNVDKTKYVEYAGAHGWDAKNNNAPVTAVAEGTLNANPAVNQNQKMKFTVTEGDRTVSKTVDVLVIDGKTVFDQNAEYVIAGQNFEISGVEAKNLVDNPNDATLDQKLVDNNGSRLQSFKKYSLETAGKVVVVDKSNITNTESTVGYDTVFGVENDSVEITLKVKVTMGEPPVIVTRKVFELPVGETFDPKDAFVEGKATNDGKDPLEYTDLDPNIFEGLTELEDNKDKVGVYKVVYKYVDGTGTEASDYTLVYVTDGSVQLTDKHIIFGENVTMKPSEVDGSKSETIKTRSGAYAYSIETGKLIDPSLISVNTTNVLPEEGLYEARIMVFGDSVGKRIKVLVAEDSVTVGDYTVSAYNTRISEAETNDTKENITKNIITKSRATGVHKTSLDPLVVFANHTLDVTKATQDVEYYVNKLETTTKVASITKKVEVITDKYVDNDKDLYISGNGFIVQKDKVAGLNEQDYIDLAGVKVEHETDKANVYTAYIIGNKLDPNNTGIQYITFGVKRGNVKLDKPVIKVDAKVIDGVVVVGDTHTLTGENFNLTGTEAKEVKDDITGAKDLFLIGKGDVKSYLNGTTEENGTVVVHDKSDVDTNEADYEVYFRVEDDDQVIKEKPTLKLTASVKLAKAPEINIITNSRIDITNNEVFNPETQFVDGTDYSTGGTGSAINYGDAGLKVTVDGVDISQVTFDEVKVYKVVYTYTDSSDQTVAKTHTLAVTDGSIVEDKGYYIFGKNAVVELDAYKAATPAQFEEMVRDQVEPKAVKVADGTDLDGSRITILGLAAVPKKVGKYTLTIAIDGAATLKTVELHITNGTPSKEGSYTLVVNDTYITQEEANLTKEDLDKLIIERSNTIAVHDTLPTLGKVIATHSINDTPGKQPVTYTIDGVNEPGKPAFVTVKEDENITEDQDVYLGLESFIIGKDQVKDLNEDLTFTKYVEAAKAHAWSDHVDGPFDIKVTNSSKLKATAGSQFVQYYVDGYPGTQKTIEVIVTDGTVVVGKDFTISAKNVSVSAADAQLILDGANDQTNMIFGDSYASVKVYDNKTRLEVTEAVTFDKKTLATAGQTYDVTYTVVNDIKATIDRKVQVSTGQMPELKVPSYQEVTLGDMSTYDLLGGVELKDNNTNSLVTPLRVTHDLNEFETTNEAGLVYINHDNFDINTADIYTVEYKAQDTNFNVAEGKQAVSVSKTPLPVADKYSIYAENVTLDYHTDVANKTDDQIVQTILDKSHGYAVHTENLTTHSLTIDSPLPSTFVKDEAVNKVEVKVVGGTANSKTDITVTITRGVIDEKDDYTITYNNAYLTVAELQALTPQQIKDLVILRAHATITPKLGQTPVLVDYQGEVKAIEDTYKVKYHIKGDATVIADDFADVVVKDSDIIEDLGDYVMTANNFPIGIKDIDDTTIGRYAELANLEIEHKVTKVKVAPNSMTKPAKKVGNQETTFTYTEGTYTNTIKVMADVMDGNVVTKEKYSIKAEPVTISVEEALIIVPEIAADNITTIAGLAKVSAFETRTKDPIGYVMVADSSTINAEGGEYEIWFKVDTQDEDVRIKVDVTVEAGVKPTLEVKEYVELPLDTATFDRRSAITKAYDNNKSQNIPFTEVEIISDDVNLNEVGVYTVEFKVTDANNNSETAKTTVLVNDGSYEIIGDYMVKAKGFAIHKSDVLSGNIGNIQLKENAEVSAYNFVEKKAVSDSDILVKSNDGYGPVAKDYSVVFKIKDVTPEVTKGVTVTVTEDKVVNGDLYSITGKNLIIGQKDAKSVSNQQDIVDLMGIKVIKRVATAPESGINVDNFTDFSTTPATYDLKFSVDKEPTTFDNFDLRVVDGDEVITEGVYTLVANDFFVGLEDLNDVGNMTPEKLVTLSGAYAIRTIDGIEDIIPAKWISGPNKQLGHQQVVYAVAERPGITIPVTATVLDGRVIESEKYYISAVSKTRPISDLKSVQNGDLDIQDIMDVKVIDKATGLEVPNMAVTVTDMNSLEPKVATYTIEFKFVDGGKDYIVKPKLSLSKGQPPVITVPKVQDVNLNSPVYDPELNVVMSDDEDDVNHLAPALVASYDDSVVQDAITNKKVGVYTVRYTTTDFDNNVSEAVYQTVVVNDGSIEVGTDYALEAHNFSINVNDVVVNSDSHLQERTGAKAYKLGANEVAGTVTYTTNYKAEVGEYDVNLGVIQDPSIAKKVVATVTKDKVKETDNYTIRATNAFIGLEDANSIMDTKLIAAANAYAENKRLGTEVDVEVVTHNVLATAGDYEVTFKVKDIDIADEDTTIKVKVTVLGSKYVVTEGETILAADDYYVGEKDIANGINNDGYVGLARAYAFNRYDKTTEYDVKIDTTTAPTNADRDVRYYVQQNPNAEVEVRAHVLAGEVVQGDDYYVKAEPITIYVSQAVKVLDGSLDIRTLTNAESKSLDGTQNGTVKVKTNDIEAKHGVYDVTFVSDQDPKAEITIKVTVDKGLAPNLIVPEYTEINVGDPFDNMDGVSAIDDRDGNITSSVVKPDNYDINKVGVYKLTYSVTDSDLNESIKHTYLIVNDGSIIVKDGYVLEAENFMINKDEVNTADNEILIKSKAHAYKIATTEEVDVIVTSKGGYSNTVGDYTIALAVDEKGSVNTTVVANVVKGAVSESDDYYLSANDITLGLDDAANISDTDIVTRADAKAVHKTLGTAGTVVVGEKTLLPTPGDYTVKYIVTEDNTSGLTRDIKVLDKDIVVEVDDFVIYADNFMVGDQFIKEMSKEDIVELANAGSYNKLNPTVELPVTQVENIITGIGTHTVTFAMQQDANVKVEVTKTIFKDVMYYIDANDAEIEIGSLTKAINNGRLESTLLGLTNAKGYRVEGDGTKVEMPVFVTNKNVFMNAPVGKDTVATLSLVDPQTKGSANARTIGVETHRLEQANANVNITVNKDKVDDKDNGGGTKDPSTGIRVYATSLFAIIIAIASLFLVLLTKRRRKEA